MPVVPSANDIYRVHFSAQDIIKRALRMLGVIAPGESLPADELTDCLEALNDMADQWNTENLNLYVLARNTFTLSAKNPFEIQPGSADFDVPRPNWIKQGQAFLSGGGLGTIERELTVYTREQWARVYRSDQTTIPSGIYYEKLFPAGKVWFDVTPDLAYTLILYLEQMLQQVTSTGTTTELSLPPGYKEALTSNLAIALAPEYGKEPPAAVINLAVTSKASLKRLNKKPLDVRGDPELLIDNEIFDINRGDYIPR